MGMLRFQSAHASFSTVLTFQKTCVKVQVMKTLEISSDSHIKTCQCYKRRATLKIPSAVF